MIINVVTKDLYIELEELKNLNVANKDKNIKEMIEIVIRCLAEFKDKINDQIVNPIGLSFEQKNLTALQNSIQKIKCMATFRPISEADIKAVGLANKIILNLAAIQKLPKLVANWKNNQELSKRNEVWADLDLSRQKIELPALEGTELLSFLVDDELDLGETSFNSDLITFKE